MFLFFKGFCFSMDGMFSTYQGGVCMGVPVDGARRGLRAAIFVEKG